MDKISIYNYECNRDLSVKQYNKAVKKVNREENNMYMRVLKSLNKLNVKKYNILLLSEISKTYIYKQLYNDYLLIYQNNIQFKNDCLNICNLFISNKYKSDTNIDKNIAIKYLLAELPIWLNVPDLLFIPSAVLIYHNIINWEKIYLNYNLMNSNQTILTFKANI